MWQNFLKKEKVKLNCSKRVIYRIAREILLPRSAGGCPLKLLYPKSKTSNSFNSTNPSGMVPEKELFRKILQHIHPPIIRTKAKIEFMKKRN